MTGFSVGGLFITKPIDGTKNAHTIFHPTLNLWLFLAKLLITKGHERSILMLTNCYLYKIRGDASGSTRYLTEAMTIPAEHQETLA
jgi:hypothetical protein